MCRVSAELFRAGKKPRPLGFLPTSHAPRLTIGRCDVKEEGHDQGVGVRNAVETDGLVFALLLTRRRRLRDFRVRAV